MTTTPYDEITFALYYDHELDQEETERFEAALQSDPELMAQYEEWSISLALFHEHIDQLESSYQLDQLSDKVMANLPEQAPWNTSRSSEPESVVMPQREGVASWWKQLWVPALVGGLAAAAILLIANGIMQSEQPKTTSTQLINHDGEEGAVIWIVDDENGEEDTEEQEEGI